MVDPGEELNVGPIAKNDELVFARAACSKISKNGAGQVLYLPA
jgi:hypothetical protein